MRFDEWEKVAKPVAMVWHGRKPLKLGVTVLERGKVVMVDPRYALLGLALGAKLAEPEVRARD